MPTVFRVDSLHSIEERLWQVNLILTSDTDKHLECISEYLRDTIHEATGFNRLAWLMIKMGELDQAKEICNRLLEMTAPNNWEEISFLHHQLGYIHEHQENVPIALNHYEMAIEITLTHQPWNIRRRCSTIQNLNSILLLEKISKGDLGFYRSIVKKAFGALVDQLHKGYTTVKLTYATPYAYLMQCALENNLQGLHHKEKGEYTLALEYYNNALDTLRPVHFYNQELATIYSNIGALYIEQGKYSEALLNFQKTLHIEKIIFPPTHPTLITTYHNIAQILSRLSRHKEAMKHEAHAINIANIKFGKDHPRTQKLLNSFYDHRRKNRFARPLAVMVENEYMVHMFI